MQCTLIGGLASSRGGGFFLGSSKLTRLSVGCTCFFGGRAAKLNSSGSVSGFVDRVGRRGAAVLSLASFALSGVLTLPN